MLNTILYLIFKVIEWAAKILSVAFLLLFVFSVLSQIVTYKKKKEIRAKQLWVSIFISIGLLLVFKYIGRIDLTGGRQWWLNYLMVPAIGFVIGFLQAKSKKLFLVENKILTSGSVWYLLLWAIPAAAIQAFYLLNLPNLTNWAIFVSMFSTALLVGTNLAMVMRYYLLKDALLK